MRKILPIAALLASLAGARARADSVTEEVSAGGLLSASTTPALGWISNRIAGSWDASDDWQVRADIGATRALAQTSEDTASTVLSISAGVELAVSDRWSVSLSGGGSPASTTRSSAIVLDDSLPGDLGEAIAEVAARSSLLSVSASVSYDTAGTSDSETSASLTAGASQYQSIQAITSLIDPDGQMLTPRQVGDHCAIYVCSDDLESSLSPHAATLLQLSLSASVTHTMEGDGDLGLTAAAYFYDRDPTQVGYFSLATLGRGNLGAGTGVAPLRYTVSPMIGNRWGRLSGTLSATYGIYIGDLGYDFATSARLQYKLKLGGASRLKLYAKLSGSIGADPDGNRTTSLSSALGAQYSW